MYSCSISEIRIDSHLGVDTSSASSHYGSRGGLTWTPPVSGEGSTPTWTEGTPSYTESSSSGEIGNDPSCRDESLSRPFVRCMGGTSHSFHSEKSLKLLFMGN